MKNAEAMYILTKLIINVPHSRGNGKSLTKSQIVEALAMGINALTEQEKNDKRRNQKINDGYVYCYINDHAY